MWPFRFDLDIGETYLLPDPGAGNHQIKLLGVKEYEWADYYTHNPARATYSRAEISVEVDGSPVLLIHRPYQLPDCGEWGADLCRSDSQLGQTLRDRLAAGYE